MEHLPEFVTNHLFLFALLVSILVLLLWNLFGAAVSGVTLINPQETIRLVNREDAVVLDIRSADDFGKGHILGAQHMSADRMGEQQADWAKYKGQNVVLCCNTGNEVLRVGRTLKMQGFEKIYCLKGGIQSWKTANLPLSRDENNRGIQDTNKTTHG